MNCLCCGKPLSAPEESCGWHRNCIKRFFGTNEMPRADISDGILEQLAAENTNRGYTVPGVQKKLSLHLLAEKEPRLTIVNYPTGYILKPQVKEFAALPQAEHLVMSMAEAAGLAVVPHALIKSGDDFAYITRRIDRVFSKQQPVQKLAMEDFCQLDMRLTQDKYKGSYERCAKIIERYSSRKGLDMTELFLLLVFSFMVGNSDMHLKNFSLIEKAEKRGEYILSQAYDLLPVNVIMPEDKEVFALALNGKKTNIRRKDFLVFAEECGISRASAEKMLAKTASMKESFIEMCKKSLLPLELQERLAALIESRAAVLMG